MPPKGKLSIPLQFAILAFGIYALVHADYYYNFFRKREIRTKVISIIEPTIRERGGTFSHQEIERCFESNWVDRVNQQIGPVGSYNPNYGFFP